MARKVLEQGSSNAEFDHHAFLYWGPEKLAVLPVSIFSDSDQPPFQGAIGFHVDRSAIGEVGRISHPAPEGSVAPISRSLVAGGRLFTLSDAGLLSSDLGSLAAGPFVAFPDFSSTPPPGPIIYARPSG